MKRIWIAVALVVVALMLVFQVVAAQGADPPIVAGAVEPPAIGWVDLYFVLAVTAFFKQQFTLGKWSILAAFVITLFVVLGPMLLPAGSEVMEAIVAVIKLTLAAAGSYDLFVDAGPKVLGVLRSRG